MRSLHLLSVAAVVLAVGCRPAKGSHDAIGGSRYAALEGMPSTSAEESARLRRSHRLKTVFVIALENHGWHQISNSRSAPYLNSVIVPQGAAADAYRAAPFDLRPSEPNYIWMEAGSDLDIRDNDNPPSNYRRTTKHLVTLLQIAGVPWKSYQQGIRGTRCPLVEEGSYQPKHNPMVFFADVTDGNNVASANCIAHVRPESELEADLAQDRVSGYVFITPDHCHNMHDACASGDNIKNGDDFLAREVETIRASKAYKDGGAIFIVWDENEGGDTSIPFFALSPFIKPGFRSQTPFSHSSLLRTVQEIFAVEPLLRDAARATSFGEMFASYP